MKKFRKHICTGLVLICVLSCFCGCGKKNTGNLFSEIAVISEDSILPRNVTYRQSIAAFREEKNVTEEDIVSSRSNLIALKYSTKSVPFEMSQAVYFLPEDNQQFPMEIYRTEYVITVKASEAEKAYAKLYDQAKAVMPEPAPNMPFTNDLENMKTGGTVQWQDVEGNTLVFSSGDAYTPEGEEPLVAIRIMLNCGFYPSFRIG